MKKHFLNYSLILFSLLSIVERTFSQKYSNEFLAIGVGARAHGMSGAQTSIAGDITAAYWNPAGLASIEAPLQVSAMHAEWFAGVGQYDYLGIAKSLQTEKKSVLAFSLIRLGIDNIPYTINLVSPDGTINYDNVSQFSSADYAFMGSYARTLKNPNLTIGASAKVIRRIIGSFGGAWGFGADLGIQYKKGNWVFGAMGRDLSTTFNAWSFNLSEQEKQVYKQTNNEIPVSSTEITLPRLILGAGRKISLNRKSSLLPTIDLECTTDGKRNVLIRSNPISIDPKFGMEYNYNGFLQVRAGVGNFQRVKDDFNPNKESISLQPNFGIGLKFNRIQLDYALTDIGNVSQVQYSHIFSLRIDFKSRKSNAQ